jgi:hypothetical protein
MKNRPCDPTSGINFQINPFRITLTSCKRTVIKKFQQTLMKVFSSTYDFENFIVIGIVIENRFRINRSLIE